MALFLVLGLLGENVAGFAIEISRSTIDCFMEARPVIKELWERIL